MKSSALISAWFRRTPLHPQWLLGSRRLPVELATCRGTVVDVGAANRWIETRITAHARYVAIDLPAAPGMPYAAWPHLFARAEALPLADECVDAVVCLEVLEHVDDPERVVAEAARVLRPNGLLVLSVPFLYPIHDRPRDFRRYTSFGVGAMVSAGGMELVAVRPMLRALEAAGLLMALALAGGVSRGGARWLLAPFALAAILLVNLGTWMASRIWPDWDAMAMGYEAVARKR